VYCTPHSGTVCSMEEFAEVRIFYYGRVKRGGEGEGEGKVGNRVNVDGMEGDEMEGGSVYGSLS